MGCHTAPTPILTASAVLVDDVTPVTGHMPATAHDHTKMHLLRASVLIVA